VSIPVHCQWRRGHSTACQACIRAHRADAVMIGRGAVMNPWIFRQSEALPCHGTLLPEATLEERVDLLREHLRLSVEYKGERAGVIELRKHYSGFLRGLPACLEDQNELMQFTEEPAPILDHLTRFLEFYSPGVVTPG